MASGASMECKSSRFAAAGLALLLACGLQSARADIQVVSQPQRGVTIDDVTGQPVAGAYVIAEWSGSYSTLAHGGTRCMNTVVVSTAADGSFSIPRWEQPVGGLDGLLLTLHAYKKGYRLVDSATSDVGVGSLARTFRMGRVTLESASHELRMRPEGESPEARARYLGQFLPSVGCSYEGKWGDLYYVWRAGLDEILELPPEVQHIKFGTSDIAGHMQRLVDHAQKQLALEGHASKESNR